VFDLPPGSQPGWEAYFMTARKIFAILGILAVLCLSIGIFADTAHAQGDSGATKRVDKGIAEKKTVSDSLKTVKKEDAKPGATPIQMAIGVGSIFVMIAVVKWL
jgi:hypothetical protein